MSDIDELALLQRASRASRQTGRRADWSSEPIWEPIARRARCKARSLAQSAVSQSARISNQQSVARERLDGATSALKIATLTRVRFRALSLRPLERHAIQIRVKVSRKPAAAARRPAGRPASWPQWQAASDNWRGSAQSSGTWICMSGGEPHFVTTKRLLVFATRRIGMISRSRSLMNTPPVGMIDTLRSLARSSVCPTQLNAMQRNAI